MATGKPKVLIAHPDPKDLGGVASFFRILEPFVNADVDHFINGRRPDEKNASFSLLRLLVDYLMRNGFQAHAARDGRELWQQLDRHAFDLIVLDLMLPDTDGLTLCRDLRGRRRR